MLGIILSDYHAKFEVNIFKNVALNCFQEHEKSSIDCVFADGTERISPLRVEQRLTD